MLRGRALAFTAVFVAAGQLWAFHAVAEDEIIEGSCTGTGVQSNLPPARPPSSGVCVADAASSIGGGNQLEGAPAAMLADAQKAGAVTLYIGVLFNAIIQFLIVSFAVFWPIKALMRLRLREDPAWAAPPPRSEVLLDEIRDLLAAKPLLSLSSGMSWRVDHRPARPTCPR